MKEVTQQDIENLYEYIKALEERIKILETLTKHLRSN
jgi:hypothetical protein